MKTLFITNVKALKESLSSKKNVRSNAAFNFSKPGFSRDEMAAVKGGEDIVITDIIGG